MKKALTHLMKALLVLTLAFLAAGCDSPDHSRSTVANGSESHMYGAAEGVIVRLATENTDVLIELNDIRAAAELLEQLPLDLELLDRAEFAKGIKLDTPLFDGETATREYSIGDFGYWPPGPDLAIFYDDLYDETLVDEIPLGHAITDATVLADETGAVRIERAN